MQQAATVQVVSRPVTVATPTSFHEAQQVQVVTMQPDETASAGADDDVQAAIAVKTTTTTSVLPGMSPEVQAQLEKDKRAVYSHPLFPLMAQLFEKCEQATQRPDPPTSASFDVDIEEFVHRQEREGKPFFSDDPEADNLMVKAIQVLRIHLLELEKVNELCKDFCHRYTTCLKGKMHSDILLRDERSRSTGGAYSPGASPEPQPPPHTPQQSQPSGAGQQATVLTGTPTSAGTFILQQPNQNIQSGAPQLNHAHFQTATVVNSAGQVVYAPVIPQGVVMPQGIVTQAIPGTVQIQTSPPAGSQQVVPLIHGSTPLSQIGMQPSSSTPQQHSGVSVGITSPSMVTSDSLEINELLNKRKPKRGVLPKHATNIMRSWLFQHIVHPYPTEDEKRMIAGQTNLTLLQVNNWFINARRRILQPMLDASNPDPSAKTKKAKTQNRPSTQRFWPESLANLAHTPATTEQSSTSRSDAIATTSAVPVVLSQAVDALSSSSSVHGDSLSPMLDASQHTTSSSPHLGNMVSNGEGDNASDLSSTVGAGDLGLDSGDSNAME